MELSENSNVVLANVANCLHTNHSRNVAKKMMVGKMNVENVGLKDAV
ncbi:hypothetical protein [Bacillus mycoides]